VQSVTSVSFTVAYKVWDWSTLFT